MLPKVKFFSGKADKQVEAEVLEIRKYTYKLKLEDGKVIVKKKKQVENV